MVNPKSITILGSTGTIGKNTIRVIEERSDEFTVEAVTAKTSVELLASQAKSLSAEIAVIEDNSLYNDLKNELAGSGIEAASGMDSIVEVAGRKVDVVMVGIVGAAALPPTLSAIKQGGVIGLANKECLVCGGDVITSEIRKHGATIIPVDSEHNSIFQAMGGKLPPHPNPLPQCGRGESIESITLTASGGPFRNFTREEMAKVTPEQAVKHPNWTMGWKISIDSATMMNKGLEVIEAYHLFPIEKNQIDVVVHPESVIHGMVSYIDGSVVAGLSVPDMRVPIAYALGYPDRTNVSTKRLDLAAIGKLTFYKPDYELFPALRIAFDCLKVGASAPIVMNAANEIAVEKFISKKIGFNTIVDTVQRSLEKISVSKPCSIEEIIDIDTEARRVASEL